MLLYCHVSGICDKLQRCQPGMDRASGQEPGEGAVEVGLVQQEGVVGE